MTKKLKIFYEISELWSYNEIGIVFLSKIIFMENQKKDLLSFSLNLSMKI